MLLISISLLQERFRAKTVEQLSSSLCLRLCMRPASSQSVSLFAYTLTGYMAIIDL